MKFLSKTVISVLSLIALLSLVAISVLAATPVKPPVNTDFTKVKFYKIQFKPTDEKVITGKLPSGWIDNSDWNPQITVSYDQVTEDGIAFLRMDKSAGGRAQLAFNISKKLPAGEYRLTVEWKSPISCTPEYGVRLTGEPYTFLWVKKPEVGDEWEVVEEDFEFDPEGAQVGVYICIEADSALDIKNIKLEQM